MVLCDVYPKGDLANYLTWYDVENFKNLITYRTLNAFDNLDLLQSHQVSWLKALRVHQQHSLQSFKNTILSKSLDQNMHKNALFLENEKITAVIGGSAPKPPLASGGWGLCPKTTELLLPAPGAAICVKLWGGPSRNSARFF